MCYYTAEAEDIYEFVLYHPLHNTDLTRRASARARYWQLHSSVDTNHRDFSTNSLADLTEASIALR